VREILNLSFAPELSPCFAAAQGDSPLHLAVWFSNHECVGSLLDYSADPGRLNHIGLDPYTNVVSRSPLAKQSRLPPGLRKALDLVAPPRAAEETLPPAPPPTPSPLPPPTPSAMEGLPPEPPPSVSRRSPSIDSIRSSNGSFGSLDEFHDAYESEE